MFRFLSFPFALCVILTVVLSAFIFSCSGSADGHDADEHDASSASAEFVTEVDVMVLQPSTFHLELVSNGRLYARRKSRLSFPLAEEVRELHIRNGQQVQAGQLLAVLCDKNLLRRLHQAELRFARASLDMEDILLGRGFTIRDSLKVPPEVWQMAGVRSGYSEALLELQNIKTDLDQTRILAPFAGVVAGVDVQVYEQVSMGKELCTLIDNTAFLVRFPVMENELARINTDAMVEIIPFSAPEKSWQGRIQNINPQVDDHGRVEVTALVSNTRGLMEGMNVRVLMKSPMPGQLVVPRPAVLYRDNLEVLFKYTQGKAEWTYVNVLHQNSKHFSVRANPDRVASLQPGDTVIVSGNANLAHGSLVTLKAE
jgi:membrane fusion protein, multidrug efflux system